MITRRCDYWYPNGGPRCEREAECRIVPDDPRPIYTGPMCREHAEMVTDEYREKLGWHWRMVKL